VFFFAFYTVIFPLNGVAIITNKHNVPVREIQVTKLEKTLL